MEESLRSCGNLFQEPDSTLLLASGMGRHWPDGRGIFCNDARNLFVWMNEEDHMRIVSMQGSRAQCTPEGKNMKEVFARFIRACDIVQSVLKEKGYDFMHSAHHGWILTCPSNLGTGLRAGTMVKLPLVSARPDFKKLLGKMFLQARGTGGVDSDQSGGTFDISNADRIGKGEVQLCNILVEGMAKLTEWEHKIESGDAAKAEAEMAAIINGPSSYPPTGLAPGVLKLTEWIQKGCGNEPYYCEEKGATFPSDSTPEAMPDLSAHSNFMAEFLRENPAVYDRLKGVTTSTGVNLAQCMKTGVDNPGHPQIKTVGLVAGDEESYTVFKELFDPIITARHNGYGVDAVQPTDLDIGKLSSSDTDPYNKYVLTSRVRTGRSVRGFKLPPVISFEDRRRLEDVVVKALCGMQGDLKGDYFPLHGSQSYAPKLGGMSEAEEEGFRAVGNLFQEPDSTLLLASGMGRHWPDGRGIFCNDARNLFVWMNEEDHMRIVSMQGSRAECTRGQEHEGSICPLHPRMRHRPVRTQGEGLRLHAQPPPRLDLDVPVESRDWSACWYDGEASIGSCAARLQEAAWQDVPAGARYWRRGQRPEWRHLRHLERRPHRQGRGAALQHPRRGDGEADGVGAQARERGRR